MPEYKLTREEIFSGRLIAPMREWLKANGRNPKEYDYNADMAIITHYLQNKHYPEGAMYEAEAIPLMQRYYRAIHPETAEGDISSRKLAELFSEIKEAPVYQRHKTNRLFTFVDLFAGIGGFRIALEQLGGRCVYASEFNKTAQKSYGMNHGVMPFGDITCPENKARIPENVDILCAGFPCQPFSMAGLRKGFADETKGTLFYDLQEIIRDKHPRVIFLENVPGLLSIRNKDEEKGKTIDTILRILKEDLGYHVPTPEIINAKKFGVPQNRERVFIVGFRDVDVDEFHYPTGENIGEKKFGAIREKGCIPACYYMSERYWQTLLRHKITQKESGRGYGYRIITDDDFGHTLMVGGMGLERNLVVDNGNPFINIEPDPRGELNHDNIRVLTERECARMQGFPEYFDICVEKSPAYNQFGNSVAIPAVREVTRNLLRHIGHRPRTQE